MTKRLKLLLAALAGLVAGVLLAPKAGRETREKLREMAASLQEAAAGSAAPPRRQPEPEKRPGRPAPQTDYDAVLIGAGHNGLVTAAYLAQAGKRVLVLERRELAGGAAVTEEFFPGFKFSACADGAGYLSPQIERDLKLAEHGLRLIPSEVVAFAPQPDGQALTIWRDTAATVREIERFSRGDAARYPAFVEQMSLFGRVVAALGALVPPDLPALGQGDLLNLLQLAGPARALGRQNLNQLLRIMPMSVADLLNEWFESDALKGVIAAAGIDGISWGPQEAGTTYTLLYRWGRSPDGLFRSAGQVLGGMGGLSRTLARAAQSYGAEIRLGAPVAEVVVEEGRAIGVRLESGEMIRAGVVVSNADPRTTFFKLLDPACLERSFVQSIQNIKYRGSQARLHLALGELPRFAAQPADSRSLHGHIQVAPTLNYLQRAYDPVKYGEMSQRPYLDIRIPTLADPSLAPEGCHTMSVTAQYFPYHLRGGSWEACRETLEKIVMETLSAYAPGIKDAVLHSKVLTPLDLERIYGLPEGNPHHGEMTLDQFFYMRPAPGSAQYRTPVENLYLCGAGAHPGGGVTGEPGRNAARQILR